MRKGTLLKSMLIGCVAGSLLAACDNDEYTGAAPAEITANYSNIPLVNNADSMVLTYSGDTVIGKNVKFITWDAEKAEIQLENVLPHEAKSTISGIALQGDGKGGYTFKGNATSEGKTSFNYEGSITKGKLTLNLKDIKIPDNALTQQETWVLGTSPMGSCANMQGLMVVMEGTQPADFGPLVGTVAGNFIASVLRDVTFHKDGNITAYYASIPSSDQFTGLLTGPIQRQDEEWKTSPLNLASYYVNGQDMYLTPNVYMIQRQMEIDKAAAAKQSKSLGVNDVVDVYNLLMNWSKTGVKLSLTPSDKVGATDKDYMITLDKEEVKPLLNLIKNLPDNITNKEIAPDKLPGVTLKQLLDMVQFGEDFRFSLYLTKATSNK